MNSKLFNEYFYGGYTVQNTIQSALDNLRMQSHEDWRRFTDMMIDMYYSNSKYMYYLERWLTLLFPNNKTEIIKLLPTFKLCKKIVDDRSIVYNSTPSRTLIDSNGNEIDEEDERYDIYNSILKKIKHDKTLRTLERRVELLNTSVLNLSPNGEDNTFRLQILNSPNILVEQNEWNPQDLDIAESVCIPVAVCVDSITSNPLDYPYIKFERDSNGISVSMMNNDGKSYDNDSLNVLSKLNSYPFILAQPEIPPDDELFMDLDFSLMNYVLWEHIHQISTKYNIRLKQLQPWVLAMSQKEYLANNSNPEAAAQPTNFVFGIDSDQMSTPNWDTKIAEFDLLEKSNRKAFAETYGLSRSFGDLTASVESGVSKFYDELPIVEHRSKMVKYWQEFESDLYIKEIDMASVVQIEGADKLLGTTMRAEFPQYSMKTTDIEKVQAIEAKRNAGLITQLEAIMEYRGVDKERAREIMDENAMNNKSSNKLSIEELRNARLAGNQTK